MAIVPPGGFAGFSQMTPASRVALFPGGRSASRSSGRRKKARRSKTARSSSSTRRSGSRKPKFGSPAWQKRYRVGKFAKKRR